VTFVFDLFCAPAMPPLPPEILRQAFALLEAADLVRCGATCKAWFWECRAPALWHALWKRVAVGTPPNRGPRAALTSPFISDTLDVHATACLLSPSGNVVLNHKNLLRRDYVDRVKFIARIRYVLSSCQLDITFARSDGVQKRFYALTSETQEGHKFEQTFVFGAQWVVFKAEYMRGTSIGVPLMLQCDFGCSSVTLSNA
jgi:hypothetical protein